MRGEHAAANLRAYLHASCGCVLDLGAAPDPPWDNVRLPCIGGSLRVEYLTFTRAVSLADVERLKRVAQQRYSADFALVPVRYTGPELSSALAERATIRCERHEAARAARTIDFVDWGVSRLRDLTSADPAAEVERRACGLVALPREERLDALVADAIDAVDASCGSVRWDAPETCAHPERTFVVESLPVEESALGRPQRQWWKCVECDRRLEPVRFRRGAKVEVRWVAQ